MEETNALVDLLAAVSKFSNMRYPSVAKILNDHGFEYEAEAASEVQTKFDTWRKHAENNSVGEAHP